MNKLENSLVKLHKKTPDTSGEFRKQIVNYLPIIIFCFFLFTSWSFYLLWNWERAMAITINTGNALRQGLKLYQVPIQHNSPLIIIGLIILGIEAICFLISMPFLYKKQKLGWCLLFYLTILNLAYGIIMSFTSYGGFSSVYTSVLITVVSLYVLFEIKDYYKNNKLKIKK